MNRSLRSTSNNHDDGETSLLECVRGQTWLDYAPIDIQRAVSSDDRGRLKESLARDKWREAAWQAVGSVEEEEEEDGDDEEGSENHHQHYNHILFTSRKGVEEFLEARCELQRGDLRSEADPLKPKKKKRRRKKTFKLWALVS